MSLALVHSTMPKEVKNKEDIVHLIKLDEDSLLQFLTLVAEHKDKDRHDFSMAVVETFKCSICGLFTLW